ncbi:hypothetical protein E3E12_05965 [Formicincola oecophyllae]|uniref:Uncharacterized protein n=1 Tax=Formicincola oecophyllae TaxID=2558361 RepID=A0A4Y6UBM0_9PROT|nr:hypothetical protein [Formicincola oecophyllae]QDH13801.1 hypothetical protein E3E12_05965 [Formicincola oecophyllae]
MTKETKKQSGDYLKAMLGSTSLSWPRFPGVPNMTVDGQGHPQVQDLIPGRQQGTPLEAAFFNPILLALCMLVDASNQNGNALQNYVSGTVGMGPNDSAGVGIHTSSISGRPTYWDKSGDKGDLAYFADLEGLQPKGNYVATGGADDGKNCPVVFMGADDATGQVWVNTARQNGIGLIAGNQLLDGYSLPIEAIKSQYLDENTRTQPIGLEYKDAAGLFMLAISKAYADTLYATLVGLMAEQQRAQGVEGTLLSGTLGMVQGDVQGLGIHTDGTSNRPIYGDGRNGWRGIALLSDLNGLQPGGNYVPTAGKDDSYNRPVTLMGVDDKSGQAWFNADGQSAQFLVAGNIGLDDYSYTIKGIKSQYLDRGTRKQPAGIEYIDENGLYMLALSQSYADERYATQSALTAEQQRAQGVEGTLLSGTLGMAAGDVQGLGVHTNGQTGRPIYGDTVSGWHDLALAADLDGLQPKGNYVLTGGADDGKNCPILSMGADDNTGQVWINSAKQNDIRVVAGNTGLDDFSYGIRGIKSQYLDRGTRKQPAGIEYIDENGLYMLAISQSYADGRYATQSALSAETARAENIEGQLNRSKVAGDIAQDDYSYPCIGIKSQFADKGTRQQSTGLLYFDNSGRNFLAISQGYADGRYATQSALTTEQQRAQNVENSLLSGTLGMATGDVQGLGVHTNGQTGRPIYGDTVSGWHDLALAADLDGLQPKGNYVATGGADDGKNCPILSMGADDNTGQVWINSAKQNDIRVVAGNTGLDDFSYGIRGIKSQFADKGSRQQPTGLLYFDDAGGNHVAISQDYADGRYATQSALTAEQQRAQGVEGTLLSGTLGMAAGDVQGLGVHTNGHSGKPTYGDTVSGWRDLALATEVSAETQARQQDISQLQAQINSLQAQINALPKLNSPVGNNFRQVWNVSGLSDGAWVTFPAPFKNTDPSEICIQITGQDNNPQSLYGNVTQGSVTQTGFKLRVEDVNSGKSPVHDSSQGTFYFEAVGKYN